MSRSELSRKYVQCHLLTGQDYAITMGSISTFSSGVSLTYFNKLTMDLCNTCRAINFLALVVACLKHGHRRQAPDSEDYDEDLAPPQRHHDDIFKIQASAQACGLCKVIFEAFRKRKVDNIEDARGIPIVFRARSNKVEVLYDAPEGLIKLCELDWYMDEGDGESFLAKLI